jgi:hypothetical protein
MSATPCHKYYSRLDINRCDNRPSHLDLQISLILRACLIKPRRSPGQPWLIICKDNRQPSVSILWLSLTPTKAQHAAKCRTLPPRPFPRHYRVVFFLSLLFVLSSCTCSGTVRLTQLFLAAAALAHAHNLTS